MSKEKDNIIQALNNIAITFDELGFEPTTANDKNYEHFNEWFLSEIEITKSNAIKQDQQIDQLKQQLAEKDKEINSLIVDYEKRISQEQELMSNMEHRLVEKQNEIDEINKEFVQAVHDWKALCAEKDKEIEDLKEWQDWYSMWHKKFQKQIEDLTTELETYIPTKLHGNGQCECFKCKQEGRQSREWTDWCSKYKGHIYCDDCLKEVLKEEQTLQTQLAEKDKEFTPKFEFRQKIYVVDNDYKGNYVIREKHYAGYFVNYYARYKYQIWCGEDNFYPVEYCFATREKAEEKIKELKGE